MSAGAEWVPLGEGSVAGARELVRSLAEAGIEAQLTAAPKKACCGGGGCGCGGKVQVMLKADDVGRAQDLMRNAWVEALAKEGTLEGGLVPLGVGEAPLPEGDSGEGDPTCPACGTQGPLADGACSDCGLQLE